ncbi:MAG TPA: hydroxymethylbilane synthase [bacterium]|nr:hydroxymethylbilane synthase [bacterium]
MSEPATFRVGTRGSALALVQTQAIIAAMQAQAPEARFKQVRVVTHGDRFREKPIAEMGETVDRGIFNTALEDALLAEEVHVTTCSFKDVQSELRESLTAASVMPREDARDVLVSRHGLPLARLPQGAVLATSSPRRVSQLKAFRPDFHFVPLRGNVTTRVQREAQRYDGIILAAAGIRRLGLGEHICETIEPDVLLPAPAQGAMGCEYRAQDASVATLVRAIQHPETETCVRAEKALLVRLSGGCFAPIGVLATVADGRMRLRCRVAALDGSRVIEAEAEGTPGDAEALVEDVRARVAAQGGLEIVAAVRDHLQAGGH